MNTATAMLLVESWDDTWSPEWEGSADDFVRDNYDDALSDIELATVAHLAVGKPMYYGAGAGARFRATRTS